MYKDYEYWYKENKDLLEHLEHHDSLLYEEYKNIIKVLNYIKDLDTSEIDNDLEVIFDEGYAYIYDRFNYIKTCLKQDFIGDLHAFLKYEELFRYYLFLEDIADAFDREDMDTKVIKEAFDNIQNKILDTINDRKPFKRDMLEEFDIVVSSFIPSDKMLQTVPEVINQIYDELLIMKDHKHFDKQD